MKEPLYWWDPLPPLESPMQYAAAVKFVRGHRRGRRPGRWRAWHPLDHLALWGLRREAVNVFRDEKRRRRAERKGRMEELRNTYEVGGTPRQGATERPREGSTRSRPRAHARGENTGHRTRD